MASSLVSSTPVSFGTKPKNVAAPISPDSSAKRRSGNYPPSLWSDDDLQLLTNNYKGDEYVKQLEELKGKVMTMLTNLEGGRLLDQLEMVDDLLRLGVAYHFADEIHNILGNIYKSRTNDQMKNDNLYEPALEFRLLREHGYDTSPEIFESFRDSTGKFRVSLCKDIQGMLSLYEASYHSFEGESTMEEAWHFTSKHLRSYVDGSDHHVDPFLAIQVTHALELPLHWRMARSEASWYIEHVYERRPDFNPVLLQLAKLDFNILQGLHQEELKDLSRWWKNIGLGEKLSFARNRLVESFFWTVGVASKPQFGSFRKNVTKCVALVTVIDDIYDVYGTLDELELFTNAVERWDIKAMKQLPHYMKICFLALYNTVNEMAYDILKEQGHDVLWNLQKTYPSRRSFNREIMASSLVSLSAPVFFGAKPKIAALVSQRCRWSVAFVASICTNISDSSAKRLFHLCTLSFSPFLLETNVLHSLYPNNIYDLPKILYGKDQEQPTTIISIGRQFTVEVDTL